MVGPSLIFYYLIFTSITFSQQILGRKLLLVLKLCIKKNKQKDNTRKLCMKRTVNYDSPNLTIFTKTMNFGLLNLTKQKKKLRNTTKYHTKKKFKNITKCHNIFIIFFISSCGWSQFDILIFNFYIYNIFTTNLR